MVLADFVKLTLSASNKPARINALSLLSSLSHSCFTIAPGACPLGTFQPVSRACKWVAGFVTCNTVTADRAHSIHCVTCGTLYSVLYTLYSVHFTVYALYNVHFTIYTVWCTVYSVQCTLYTVHCTVYIVHCTIYTLQYALYSVHCTLYMHCTYHNVSLVQHVMQLMKLHLQSAMVKLIFLTGSRFITIIY